MLCNIPYPDLHQRLDNTVCTYKGKAVLIRTPDYPSSSGKVYLYRVDVPDEQIGRIDSRDPDFDIATPPLGYCQLSEDQVAYITRLPFRKYKQGITYDNCGIQFITKNPMFGWDLYSEPTVHMIEKHYPRIRYVLETLSTSNKHREVAISNDCALVNSFDTIRVFFRMEEIGFIKKNGLDDIIVYVPSSRKVWIIERYMRDFGFKVCDLSLFKNRRKRLK